MLSALKFTDFKFAKKEMKVHSLPIDKIRPNPYQPRKSFDKTMLEELSNSIRRYGVMQPIHVRLINGCSYELVAGERRLRASLMAGLTTIPAIIVDVNDNDSAIIALIENIQRQNLNFMEEAEGYQNIIQDYGLTQEELAQKLGKNQSTIANKLRILKLSPEMRKLILEHSLTERHARALLKIPDEFVQKEVILQVIAQDLTVKRTEKLVEEALQKLLEYKPPQVEQKIKRNFSDIRLLTNSIKQSVDLIQKSGVEATYQVEEKIDCCEILIQIPYTYSTCKIGEEQEIDISKMDTSYE